MKAELTTEDFEKAVRRRRWHPDRCIVAQCLIRHGYHLEIFSAYAVIGQQLGPEADQAMLAFDDAMNTKPRNKAKLQELRARLPIPIELPDKR